MSGVLRFLSCLRYAMYLIRPWKTANAAADNYLSTRLSGSAMGWASPCRNSLRGKVNTEKINLSHLFWVAEIDSYIAVPIALNSIWLLHIKGDAEKVYAYSCILVRAVFIGYHLWIAGKYSKFPQKLSEWMPENTEGKNDLYSSKGSGAKKKPFLEWEMLRVVRFPAYSHYKVVRHGGVFVDSSTYVSSYLRERCCRNGLCC